MLIQICVNVLDYLDLLLDDLLEYPTLNCKHSHRLHPTVLDSRGQTHPQRHSRNYFQHNAAETPNIDDPTVLILLHFVKHQHIVLQFVLKQDIVENLRWHVFGGSH